MENVSISEGGIGMTNVCSKARETIMDILATMNVYVATDPKQAKWGPKGYLDDLYWIATEIAVEKGPKDPLEANPKMDMLNNLFAANEQWIRSERTAADDADYDAAVEFVRNRLIGGVA